MNARPEDLAAAAARRRVSAALLEIQQFDTDREFVVAARRRYLELKDDAAPADSGANIVMSHTNIRTGN